MKQRKDKTLAIDFDGTICKYQPFKDGVIWQTPNEGAKEVITKLYEKFNIAVFSCRARPDWEDYEQSVANIEEWLKKYEIPFDLVTGIKPIAIAYIDDRGLRFTNWQDMKNYFI